MAKRVGAAGPDGVVVCLGACAVDMMFTVDRLPQPDEMVFAVGEVGFFPGGSTANIAAGTGRLGYPARFVGRTGDDENGRRLRQAFESDGVDTKWLSEIRGGRTAQTIIAVDRAGERVIYSLGGEAILQEPSEFTDGIMENGKVLYIGEVLPDVGLEAIRVARAHDATVIYGPGGGLSWMDKAAILELIKSSDYVLLSRRELISLSSCERPNEGARRLLESGVANVVVTLGSEGSQHYSRDGLISHASAFHVPDVLDTTGAGDSFASGFITGLLEGMDIADCLVRGNACAALAIRKVGAREAMPTAEELEEFLKNAK
ncbi:MAG TPA: carbohydrate kinase family protein [Bacillota bacterium]|jgi:sugar/nucleoside kinase (ribokinase family)|nr:carbohydrate kinase family protein [Bacillota bacterium]HQD81023.1 carbohydrate kinase family protein [Bacillota bacterium]